MHFEWNRAHLLGLALWIPVGAILLANVTSATATALWLMMCLLGFALAERLWPYRREWHPTRRAMGMDSMLLLLAALMDSALRSGGLWMAQWLASHGHSPGWATSLPLTIAVPVAILVGEFGPYVLHRWAHHSPLAWRWHRLHHTPEQVNASNSVRVHPLNLAWNLISRGLPWWALGFTPEALAWATMFLLLQGVAVHANVQGRIGLLAWLIGSAEAHRLHHSTKADEGLNYATAVPLWDQLLGTWRRPVEPGPKEVGLIR